MPKLTGNRVPKYRLHKQSGQAIVTLSGKDHLLGKFDSAGSRRKYARLIGEWLASNRAAPPRRHDSATPAELTIIRLVAEFWRHAKTYHKPEEGRDLAAEAIHYRTDLRVVVKLYGKSAATSFGPLSLKAVRETMVGTGWARSFYQQPGESHQACVPVGRR